jgi:hypothetical protein
VEIGLRLFGTPARSRTLLAIALLGQTYPREVSRVARVPLMSVQRIIDDLERQNVLASRINGNQREVRLNPSYFAAAQLRDLLLRLAPAESDLTASIESLRRRPRRAGKEL